MDGLVSDVILDVESAMTTVQRRAAYARFVGMNPEFAGAFWADILEHLVETEAHRIFLDSAWDEHLDDMGPETAPFYSPAYLSLMYSEGEPPTHERAMVLALAAARISGGAS